MDAMTLPPLNHKMLLFSSAAWGFCSCLTDSCQKSRGHIRLETWDVTLWPGCLCTELDVSALQVYSPLVHGDSLTPVK